MDEHVLSYHDLDELSSRAASWLAGRGIAAGDRVGLMLPNVPEFAVLYYGILRAGAIVVPMNPLLKAREVDYYLSDSQASDGLRLARHRRPGDRGRAAGWNRPRAGRAGRVRAGTRPLRAPHPAVADRLSTDTAVILYTSGTTGQPKGAELTHDNLLHNVEVTSRDAAAPASQPTWSSARCRCSTRSARSSGWDVPSPRAPA